MVPAGKEDSKSGHPAPIGPALRAWLKFDDREVEVAQGETLIGRSAACGVAVDDPLVSRSHARLFLRRGSLSIEDLGSANGSLVNGAHTEGVTPLAEGDRVVIGHSSFEVHTSTSFDVLESEPRLAATTRSVRAPDFEMPATEVHGETATRRGDALDLLVGLVEKVLVLGRGEEAERILASYLRNLLRVARASGYLDLDIADKASIYAAKIAAATGKGTWVDYLFELYSVPRRPLPADVVDRLYDSVRHMSPISVHAFRQYLSALQEAESNLGPAERFLVRRIEGLESLGVLR